MGHLKDLKSARDYYEQVFTMAPMLHEAYIEAGNLISKQDPLGYSTCNNPPLYPRVEDNRLKRKTL